MKLCPNCHRLSNDDDFCSFCGSAVYEDNTDYSIDCSQIKGHTHEKQTFSENTAYPELNRGTSHKPKNMHKGSFDIIIFFVVLVGLILFLFGGGIFFLFDII